MLNGKSVLVTGGTGSFGQKFVKTVLERYRPRRLIILSRDELKQYEMQQVFNPTEHSCLRYFLGDVRDRNRLYRAFYNVDIVIHAAALKQVPAAEYNPFEFIMTNIHGTQNVIEAAIDCGVKKVLAVSTDKAVNPVNLYGATKLCMEKLVVAANSYAGGRTKFGVVRYGNVVGSRGSVVPLFLKMKDSGILPVTDPRMTRFWITLQQGIDFVLKCLERLQGSEIFVPKIPSMHVTDLAHAICPVCEIKVIGIRPGEKLDELLISSEESREAFDMGDYYVVHPKFSFIKDIYPCKGQPVPEGTEYSSGTNERWLSISELQAIITEVD